MWYLPKTVQLYGSLQQLNTMDLKYPAKNDNVTDIVTSNEDFKNYDLSLKNVSFHYPTMTNNILDDISLDIPYKSNILIKGRIGAGKSTIMRLLLRWYQPQKGTITLDGKSIYDIKHSIYSKIVYMMSQNTTLFSNRSVLENILYNSDKNISARQLSNMFDLPKNFTNILNKEVLHHGMNISGGQKRLVHLLRCFFHPAKIFILDEPTDNLDAHLTTIVLNLIKKLQKDHTVICISHDHRVDSIFSNVFSM
jgi:ABC-type bacteriocin/lantibiotic exporter with double-glycine peptidase domain